MRTRHETMEVPAHESIHYAAQSEPMPECEVMEPIDDADDNGWVEWSEYARVKSGVDRA